MSPVPPEVLQQLGLALGLLKKAGTRTELNNEWLARPGDFLGSVLRSPEQREAAISVARTVLGELDDDVVDQVAGESWISIVETAESPSAGLFAVVSTPQGPDGPLLLSFAFKLSSPTANGSAGATAIVRVPLAALDVSPRSEEAIPAPRLLLGTAEGVISLLVSLEIDEAGGDGTSLRAAMLSGSVPSAGDEAPSFSIALKGLRLGGAADARDVVFDSEHADLGQALQILQPLLAQDDGSILHDLFALLGLSPGGPLPPLDPQALLERGMAGVSGRFAEVLSDPAGARAIAAFVARMLGLEEDRVSGSGTTADPFTLRLGSAGRGYLDLLLAIHQDVATNSVAFTPSIKGFWPAEPGAVGGEAHLFTLTLGPQPNFAPLSRMQVFGRAGGGAQQPLVRTEVSGHPLRVGHFDAGIALDEAFRPTIELVAGEVSFAGTEYPFLDLRSVDIVSQLAEVAGSSITDQLTGALDGSDAGRALAASAGLVPPEGVTAARWVDPVGAGELLTDPVGAIARYLGRVFDHEDKAPRLVQAFAAVLGGDGEVQGTGTESDPWTTPLDAGSQSGSVVELALWLEAAPRQLHIALGLAVDLELGDISGDFRARAEVVSFPLPNGTADSSSLPGLGSRQELAMVVHGPIALGTADRGVGLGGLDLVIARSAAAGLRASLTVREPVVRGSGRDASLPDLVVRSDGSVEPEDLSASAWSAVGDLAHDRLGALGSPRSEHLAALLGWGKEAPEVSLAEAGFSVPLDSGELPRFDVRAFVSDPVAACRDWARDILASAPGTLHAAGRLAAISQGVSFDPDRLVLPSMTTHESLARVVLGSDGGAALRFVGEKSLGLGQLDAVKEALLGHAGESIEDALKALGLAQALSPRLEGLARGRDLPGLVERLRELAGSDGLVPEAAQTRQGWQRYDVVAGHLGAPAALDVAQALPGVSPERCLFVSCDLPGMAPWRGQTPERVVDLTAPGVTPDALNLTAAPDKGPWFLLIPRRSLGTASSVTLEDQAALIDRAVLGLSERLDDGETGIAVIAHSVAGHAALVAAAAAAAGTISHLATVATPHKRDALEHLDDPVTQDGLALVRGLASSPPPEGAAATVVQLVAAASRAGDPASGELGAGAISEEFLPPESLPAAADVHRVAVVASADVDTVREGIADLIRAAIERECGGSNALRPVESLGVDLEIPLQLPEIGALRLSGELRIGTQDLLPQGDGASPTASIGIHLDAHGTQGWLVSPTVAGGPALRYVDLQLTLDGGGGSSILQLHDAYLYGVHRPLIEIRLDSAEGSSEFDALTRTVLGAMANSAGSVPDGGPERALIEIASLLGLVTLGPEGVAASQTGVERFLAAPGTVLKETFSAGLADVLLQLFPTSAPESGIRIAGTDEIGVLLDPQARKLTVSTQADGLEIGGLGRLEVDISLAGGGVEGHVGLSPLHPGPLGPTRARFELSPQRPATATVVRAGEVTRLAPDPDTENLKELAVSLAAGGLASSLFDEFRDKAGERVEPLLAAVGLIGQTENPRRLWRDPASFVTHLGEWLAALQPAGNAPGPRSRAMIDAVRALLNLDGEDGKMNLPWGLTLEGVQREGAAFLSLSRELDAVSDEVAAGGTLRFALVEGAPPELETTVRLLDPGEGFDSLTVEATLGREPSATLRLDPSSGSEIELPLLPASSLAGLAADGAAAVLPMVLDALGAHETLGPPLGALGTALDLRKDDHFDEARLREAGEDPGGHLAGLLGSGEAPRKLIDSLGGVLRSIVGSERVSVEDAKSRLRLVVAESVAVTLEADGALVCEVEESSRAGLRFAARAETSGVESPRIEKFHAELAVVDPEVVSVHGVSLFPFLTLDSAEGSTVDVGLLTSPEPESEAVFGRFGGENLDVMVRSTDGAEHSDSAMAGRTVARHWLLPIAAEAVLALQAVEELLEREVSALDESIKDLLLGTDILRTHSSEVGLNPDFVSEPLKGLMKLALRAAEELAPITLVDGLEVAPKTEERDGTRIGVRFSIGQRVQISLPGDLVIAIETDTGWIDDDPDGGLDLLFLSLPPGADAVPEIRPWIRVRGVGVRLGAAGGDKLFDLGVSVRSVALHGHYEAIADSDTGALRVEASGAHVVVNDLALPLARAAGGSNPVANKVLGQSRESGTELAPTFSPELITRSNPASIELRMGGGNPPWWVPVQRSFGPLYVEQVGINVTSTGEGPARQIAFVTVLMDGGVSIAGLSMAVDDLALTIPANSPFAPQGWSVDLAGLAVAYDSSGVKIAGGLRKIQRDGAVEYAGMLEIRFAQFGLTAVGSYGEFPQPSPPADPNETYSSFFVFAALDYPIGGPPAFFVTGLGAGIGLNRQLVLPQDVTEVPSHTLISAMDSNSGLAADPMKGLDRMARDFPPEPGTFWLALGVRFTSFVLVESIAVLSAEVGGQGVEIGLLGLSRMDLPSRDFVMARIELALRARFSTREALIGVQGQLTDNSWLIHPSCRLTGGFAFYVWFEHGDFVLTLGGYHPRFNKPAHYPDVPRLGYNWSVSDALTIKGESYFAITASCVMAGGSFEASFDAGIAWAAFRMGWDALISWDPFFYDFEVYVSVSAGVQIRVCAPFGLGCATIRISLSIGASVRVWGPELRGRATLDLDVTSVTVAFGASDEPNSKSPLTWTAFHEKYLVAGDPDGATMAATIARGYVPVNAEAGETAGTGSSADPWRVLPEFTFVTQTRSASNRLEVAGGLSDLNHHEAIDLGPMQKTNVLSKHRVSVAGPDGAVVGLPFAPATGNVPEATWGIVRTDAEPAARVRPAYVGSSVEVAARIETAETATAKLEDVERSKTAHPLPFHQEFEWRADFEEHAKAALDYMKEQPTATAQILDKASTRLTALEDPLARVAYARDVAAPPRFAPLSEGLFPDIPAPVPTEPTPEPPVPAQESPTAERPHIESILRLSPATTGGGRLTTTVSAASDVERVAPPTLAQTQVGEGPVPSRLSMRTRPAIQFEQTIAALGAPVFTARAGAIREARRSLLSDSATAASLRELDRQLETGLELLGGDMFVLTVPKANLDADPVRPVIVVNGDQSVRVVMLDRAGDVLVDMTGSSLEVIVPPGTDRILLAALGPDAVARSGGDAGWHTGAQLVQLSSDVYVGSDVIVRATSPETKRLRSVVTSAIVTGADAVTHADLVETRLPPRTTALIVGLENIGAVDDPLRDLALSLTGAQRVAVEGVSQGPKVVVSGNRMYAVFAIVPDPEVDVIVATVAAGPMWELIGVGGSAAPIEEVARVLSERGIDGTIPALVGYAGGSSTVTWRHGGA